VKSSMFVLSFRSFQGIRWAAPSRRSWRAASARCRRRWTQG